MKKPTKAELIEDITETFDLKGGRMRIERFNKGLVNFSTIRFDIENQIKSQASEIPNLALKWQSYTELNSDSGYAAIFDVLHQNKLTSVDDININILKSEIQNHISKSAWDNFERYLSYLNIEREGCGHDEVFIIAAWADLFAEPFDDLWLASMANHAYFVLNDDFAFGYFTALLHQKKHNEGHFLRGKHNLQSAKLGGLARSRMTKTRSARILSEIRRLINGGHSLSRASELAYSKGFGTSPEANRKLWNRHLKK